MSFSSLKKLCALVILSVTTLGLSSCETLRGVTGGNDGSLLGRPLRVGIVTWPGYAGGIVANNGFKPNKDCIFWNNHKQTVEFLLLEDVDVRAKAFAKGGPDGVDIVWSTVDFWANELPGFVKTGTKARAIMQVDWSRGGDAIVADQSIKTIEDLKGKQISLALFTPSHWLLEYSLQNSKLNDLEQTEIVKNLVGKTASPDARADFVANKVPAAVVWEPDVVEALNKRPGAHILFSSKTAANLIADIMVAREDFIKEHPDVVKAFVQGWLEGAVEANRNPDKAVTLLMENEPLYQELGAATTKQNLTTVKLADLTDNTRMFGLDGKSEPLFNRIFTQAGASWVKRGYITNALTPDQSADLSFLREYYALNPVQVTEEFTGFEKAKPANLEQQTAVMSKPVSIYFASGSSTLDPNARAALDQVVTLVKTVSNAYIIVEGNTDNVGSPESNKLLSQRRAQSVLDYLAQAANVDKSRFEAVGNGMDVPFDTATDSTGKRRAASAAEIAASNSTEEGKAKNRRTEIKVIPR
jgi:NitT/TauT family transport system substrate-binding protein